MNGNEVPKASGYIENPKEVAEALGHGRLSIEEKRAYIEEHSPGFFRNSDFVSVETYTQLFSQLDLNNKKVIDVGAGYAIAPIDTITSPMVKALQEINPHLTLIPFDYNHIRSRSWLLLDAHPGEETDNINLEPVTGDATQLPFPSDSLDGYLSSNLINEPRAADSESSFVKKMIKEAYRVLKPGGFLVLSSFGYFIWKLDSGTVIYNDNIDVEEIVTKEQIIEILSKAGFRDIAELPLDEELITIAVEERVKRKTGAIDGGLHDTCAFIAKK